MIQGKARLSGAAALAADVLVFLSLVAAALAWFSFIEFRTLMGDDILSIIHLKDYGSAWSAFTDGSSDKYRPLFMAAYYLLFRSLGTGYVQYLVFNILLLSLAVFIAYKIFDLILEDRPAAALFAMVFMTARFSYYNVMQLAGLMEGLALLFFSMTLFFSVKYERDGKLTGAALAACISFILPFINERFLVVSALLPAYLLVRGGKAEKVIAVFSFMSVPLNIALKTLALKVHFLQGTDGKPLNFDSVRIMKFFLRGILNMLGINVGPGYLAGTNIENMRPDAMILSAAIFFFCIFLIVRYFWGRGKTEAPAAAGVTAAAVFFGLVFVASITIRQEYRWLYAPYLLFLAILAIFMKRVFSERRAFTWAVAVFVAVSFYNNIYHRDHLNGFYILYAQKCADSLYDATVGKYGRDVLDKNVLYIQNFEHRPWITGKNGFFEIYTGNKPGDRVRYFDDVSDLDPARMPANARILLMDHKETVFREIGLREISRFNQETEEHDK